MNFMILYRPPWHLGTNHSGQTYLGITKMEAEVRIELTYNGFAIRCITTLLFGPLIVAQGIKFIQQTLGPAPQFVRLLC